MTGSALVLVDTNVLLRFLTGDHAEQSPVAAAIFRRASAGELVLEVPASVVSETVFTLGKIYNLTQTEIGKKLAVLLTSPCVKFIGPEWMLSALEEFGSTTISFGDACVAAVARERNVPVLTFDKGYQKIPGLTVVRPEDLAARTDT